MTRKLKIGYWPLSESLLAAGDRRRLVFWANARGHEIVRDLNQKVDVIVASENSDFNASHFTKKSIPIIFDLVDAYLSPLSPYDDFARGVAKHFSGQISGEVKAFSHHVRDFCKMSNAVVCSSPEQQELILQHNNNSHVVLDSHEEIPFVESVCNQEPKKNGRGILWEGQPATIRGVKTVYPVLAKLAKSNDLNFNFVTDEIYYQFLNKYLKRNTSKLLKKDLPELTNRIKVTPWSPSALIESARNSSAAMIPIDLNVPMQRLKPENRLLIMWRLGLPCLTSPSPAYSRVSHKAGVTAICRTSEEWSENITRLLSEPQYAHNEVAAGQLYLRENHNKTLLLKKWDLVFESVMG
jgi:hypothetical protein